MSFINFSIPRDITYGENALERLATLRGAERRL